MTDDAVHAHERSLRLLEAAGRWRRSAAADVPHFEAEAELNALAESALYGAVAATDWTCLVYSRTR